MGNKLPTDGMSSTDDPFPINNVMPIDGVLFTGVAVGNKLLADKHYGGCGGVGNLLPTDKHFT